MAGDRVALPQGTLDLLILALPPSPTIRGEPSELAVIGRLAPRVPLEQAQAELDVHAADGTRVSTAKRWFNYRATPMVRQVVGNLQRPIGLGKRSTDGVLRGA